MQISRVSSGSYDLNNWLLGGYEKEIVTMIVGGPASGKTNLTILAACSVAREKKVVFIDTEGGFSTERVFQIVGEENVEKILSNIFILKPIDFKSQKESFIRLREFMNKDVGLVVVDSIAMLYRLEIAKKMSDMENQNPSEKIRGINCEMVSQVEELSRIARENRVPVLITNQIYSKFGLEESLDEINIVGGDLFQYWSKCIIELKKGRNRKAILLKHRSLPVKEIFFEIRDEGVFRKKGIF